MPTRDRIVMLVDLDYFFAQCEELRNPELKTKPVVVGVYSGRTKDSGAVSTSNYLARTYGVKSGIPLFLAKKRLENVDSVFLPVDHPYYSQISDKIMNLLEDYADSFEQAGIDEAYLDVTGRVHGSFEETKDLVAQMKQAVKEQVGVTFSVGVGPNKLIAKMASDRQKPDGLTIILPAEVAGFLVPLPVDALLGVGRKTVLKMDELGIKTVGDLARYDVQRLVSVFGKVLGVYFHNAANGVDNDPVQETGEAESISRIGTLKEDSHELVSILEKAYLLAEDVFKELHQKNLTFRQVSIVGIMTDLSTRSRSQTLDSPTKDLETMKKTVGELFEKFLSESEQQVRRVGVRVSHLGKEERRQQQLTSFFSL
jgi:DNA polymerase IV (DinB-like DNA polymerase)